MKTTSSMVTWLAILVVVLVAVTVWNAQRLRHSSAMAGQAVADTLRCAELAGSIIALREEGPIAPIGRSEEVEWAGMIQQASQAAGWSTDENLYVIRPLPPQRIARTNQERRRVDIRLRHLKLSEAVHLLHELTLHQPGLHVENLYLTAPEGHGPQARWNLEPVMLSYRARATNDE